MIPNVTKYSKEIVIPYDLYHLRKEYYYDDKYNVRVIKNLHKNDNCWWFFTYDKQYREIAYLDDRGRYYEINYTKRYKLIFLKRDNKWVKTTDANRLKSEYED